MKKTLRTRLSLLFFLLGIGVTTAFASDGNKAIYVPSTFGNIDLNNTASQWCYQRSQQSDDFIVFWEAGYGANPKTTGNSSYRIDVDALLNLAETSFKMYRDSLQFIEKGHSKTDSLKMIILLFYTTDWMANGSGIDDQIGLLNLSASGAQSMGVTVAHEVGHCFQYQVHCDGFPGGWMYGFGPNGSGGNCWWEQCAQWQAFKVFPDQQFSNYQFSNYLSNAYKNILHEEPRYANYFIQDYWTYLHGIDFIGRLWRESKYPEDPVDAYKRIVKVSQAKFNDEIYDCASRFVTWDIPALREYGKNYIAARESSPMTLTDDDYWRIDSSKCIENYGYNSIRLNLPDTAKTIAVYFQGLAGEKGYRSIYRSFAGWRYGLVALQKDGSRVYSQMRSPSFNGVTKTNPRDTLTFNSPENCDKLWLVVTGAPTLHWRHAWDDDDTNDEQWPYEVKFVNTNRYGEFNFTSEDTPHNETLTQNLTLTPVTANTNPYPSTAVQPNWESVCRAFRLQLSEIQAVFGSTIKYCAVQPNGAYNFTSTANAPGHWFNKSGYTTNWGNSSYIFSEFNLNSLAFNIGQYPNYCKDGDQFTIRQALIYSPGSVPPVIVTFVFNISISSGIPTAIEDFKSEKLPSPVKNTLVKDVLYLVDSYDDVVIRDLWGRIIKRGSKAKEIYLGNLPSGIYLVSANGVTVKIFKASNY
ncbi:MAG TPA: DUF6055 domain-containing protein [Sunxiuqinia sp.]|nr:DUF6055 domain-containing protein [Sunxiuqinia sp.]